MAWKGTTLHGKETSIDINETLRTVDINSIRLKCKFAHGIQMNFWIVAVSLKYIYWFKSLKYLIFFVRNYNSWTILPPIEMFNNLVDSVGFGKAGNGSRGCGIYRRQRWQFIEAFECQWRQRTRKTRREGNRSDLIVTHTSLHFTSLYCRWNVSYCSNFDMCNRIHYFAHFKSDLFSIGKPHFNNARSGQSMQTYGIPNQFATP